MTILQLSDAGIGALQPSTRGELISQWDGATQNQLHVADNLPQEAQCFHKNYIEYLRTCWRDHLGIVVTPDILWHILLGELVAIVRKDVEGYRSLFTTSPGKETIIVEGDGSPVISMAELEKALRTRVPTEVDLFLPKFSTQTLRSLHAMRAMFCDMCSPYYDYCMLTCAFPLIDVRGYREDYEQMAGGWRQLSALFKPAASYMDRVTSVLSRLLASFDKPAWWRSMCSFERCGSGSVRMVGWLTDLYYEKPAGLDPAMFPPTIGVVSYENLDDKRKYEMHSGLFSSRMDGNVLRPEFSYIVHEKLAEPLRTPINN